MASAGETSSGGVRPRRAPRSLSARGGGAAKYSRLEAEVAAMQRDSGTYCDEPADTADYQEWLKVIKPQIARVWDLVFYPKTLS